MKMKLKLCRKNVLIVHVILFCCAIVVNYTFILNKAFLFYAEVDGNQFPLLA